MEKSTEDNAWTYIYGRWSKGKALSEFILIYPLEYFDVVFVIVSLSWFR
jgi:hypothetical protein